MIVISSSDIIPVCFNRLSNDRYSFVKFFLIQLFFGPSFDAEFLRSVFFEGHIHISLPIISMTLGNIVIVPNSFSTRNQCPVILHRLELCCFHFKSFHFFHDSFLVKGSCIDRPFFCVSINELVYHYLTDSLSNSCNIICCLCCPFYEVCRFLFNFGKTRMCHTLFLSILFRTNSPVCLVNFLFLQ